MKNFTAFILGAIFAGAGIYVYKNKATISDKYLKKYFNKNSDETDTIDIADVIETIEKTDISNPEDDSSENIFYMDENGNIQEGAAIYDD